MRNKEDVIKHAISVFGTEEKAMEWLDTERPLLFRGTAMDKLASGQDGLIFIDDILGRIEHGIYS